MATKDHWAAMTKDLVFHKRLNDLLLQLLRQLKPTTDKLITKFIKLYLCYKTIACEEQQGIL